MPQRLDFVSPPASLPPMAFAYHRTIHFAETDAAGIVFFARYLMLCHEAYEESIAAAGLDVARVFSTADGLMLPITRSHAEYLRPLRAGDKVRISVAPTRLNDHSFSLAYEITRLTETIDKIAARATTEHTCIAVATRERTTLPPELAAWIDAG